MAFLKTVKPALIGLCGIFAILAACVSGPQSESPGTVETPPSKIIAIGDMHGDGDAYFSILRDAGLIDKRENWIGGDTVFVQTGDIPDRGPDSRRIIKHLQKISAQAKTAGGRVVPLIGNHEAMVMIGDLRYVHSGEIGAFARPGDPSGETGKKAVMDRFSRAWSPKGSIGHWVSANDAIAIIDGNIFVHGGISREYSKYSIGSMNADVRSALRSQDTDPRSIINDPIGPLWYRGLIGFSESAGPRNHDLSAPEEVDWVLDTYNAKRIIVGHTPRLTGIKASHDGKLIRIDTGASSYYGGTRSFLRIENGDVFAHDGGKVRKLN